MSGERYVIHHQQEQPYGLIKGRRRTIEFILRVLRMKEAKRCSRYGGKRVGAVDVFKVAGIRTRPWCWCGASTYVSAGQVTILKAIGWLLEDGDLAPTLVCS